MFGPRTLRRPQDGGVMTGRGEGDFGFLCFHWLLSVSVSLIVVSFTNNQMI